MGKCISKPVAAAATAVDLPVKKPSVSQGATGVKSSDRSLQHLFDKDVEEEEPNNGQLKRIPEEDSSGEEQEKTEEKPGSLETILEVRSPDTEDEGRKAVVVQAERTVPPEVEKREVQLEPLPTVVVGVSSVLVEVEQPVTATVSPSTPEISESKSPPEGEGEQEHDQDDKIHNHSEKPLEEADVREIPGSSTSSPLPAVEPLKEGEKVGEVDIQVVPEPSPREIQVNTDGVIAQSTCAPLEETHTREQAEEAIVDVNEVHEGETSDLSMEDKVVKEVHEEQMNGSEPGSTEVHSVEVPVEDKLASESRQQDYKDITEEKRSSSSATPAPESSTSTAQAKVAEGPSSVAHTGDDDGPTLVEVRGVLSTGDPVEVYEAAPTCEAHVGVPELSSSVDHVEVRGSAIDVPEVHEDAVIPPVQDPVESCVQAPDDTSSRDKVEGIAHVQVPDGPSTEAKSEAPEDASSRDKVEAIIAPDNPSSEAKFEVPESSSSDIVRSTAKGEAPEVPGCLARVEVPQDPSSVAHHELGSKSRGSEQEFFEASEQIQDLQGGEEPKAPSNEPKSSKAAETTVKVEVRISKTDTVQPMEETRADPSSTS